MRDCKQKQGLWRQWMRRTQSGLHEEAPSVMMTSRLDAHTRMHSGRLLECRRCFVRYSCRCWRHLPCNASHSLTLSL